MNNLEPFDFDRPGNTASALARKAGTTTASVTRILRGEQMPSVAMIKAIVGATGGAVTADELIFGDGIA